MRFWEALREYENGHRIRAKSWDKDCFISIEKTSGVDWLDYESWLRCLQKEWEIYQEPRKTLSFMEVVEGLRGGKKFRRARYPKSDPIYLIENRDIYISGETWGACRIEDFEATDWIEVK